MRVECASAVMTRRSELLLLEVLVPVPDQCRGGSRWPGTLLARTAAATPSAAPSLLLVPLVQAPPVLLLPRSLAAQRADRPSVRPFVQVSVPCYAGQCARPGQVCVLSLGRDPNLQEALRCPPCLVWLFNVSVRLVGLKCFAVSAACKVAVGSAVRKGERDCERKGKKENHKKHEN